MQLNEFGGSIGLLKHLGQCWDLGSKQFALGVHHSPPKMVRVLRTDVARKPWGQGKAALQKHVRNRTAFEAAQLVLDRMDLDQVQMTGQLFPRGTLKKPAIKRMFDWVHSYQGRVWTKAMLRQMVRILMRSIPNIPVDPSKKIVTFVKQQSKRLGILIRQAKRIKAWGFQNHRKQSSDIYIEREREIFKSNDIDFSNKFLKA